MASDNGSYNDIGAVIAALHAGAIVGNRNAAKKVAQKATDNCPVKSGFTRATVYRSAHDASNYQQAVSQAKPLGEKREVLPEIDRPEDDLTSIVAYAAASAIYVHDGTAHIAPNPWLAEGVADVDVGEEMAEAINAAIKRAARHSGE